MKISELEDAPKWLIDADTEGADVEIRDGVVIWHGGEWVPINGKPPTIT